MKRELIVISLLIGVGGLVTAHLQKRSDDVSTAALEVDVTRLASQMTSFTAEITALKAQLTSQQTKIGEFIIFVFKGFLTLKM